MKLHNMQPPSEYEGKIEILKREALSVLQCGYWENAEKGIRTLREKGRCDFQLIYIDKGSLNINGKSFNAKSLYVFLPDEKQDYITSDDGTEYYWIHFCGKAAKKYVPEISENFGYGASFKAFVKNAVSEYSARHKLYKQKVHSDFMSLMILILRSESTERNKVEKAISHICSHYTEPYSNKEYAVLCNMSERAFLRAFRKKTGKTPQSFCKHLMIEAAKNLLVSTTLKIGDIARLSGFQDSFYFSRVFKKQTGISPLKYRKELRL